MRAAAGSFQALFSLKALRSPAPVAKTFALFFCGLRLENSAQNFCSCDAPTTASAAALKLKIAIKSWSLVFTAATASFRIP